MALALPEVDTAAERARLEKELAEAEAHLARTAGRLADPTFRSKAPAHVIAGNEATLAETQQRVDGLRSRIAAL